ncbi:MAG TPA: mismatch-specific DNA-glycosylase [Candidatus Deferrimicrobiaceae bacterium]
MTAPEIPWKPTKAQLAEAASTGTVADVIKDGLSVLFVGINPGLYSGAIHHHFGRPGNRFWPALYASGFTPQALSPFEERALLGYGLGITNLVGRTTATAAEVTTDELVEGAEALAAKVRRHRPGFVAFLGLTSYRAAFRRPKAVLGLLPDPFAGTRAWLLPNPSGLNAHHQPADLARMFGELRVAAGAPPG